MADLNDFKLINKRVLKYFDYLKLESRQFTEVDKKRIGFYFLILESVTGIKYLGGI